MGLSGRGFGQVASSFGQPMTPIYAMHNAQPQAGGPWSAFGMKHANTLQTTCNLVGATLGFESLQQSKDSKLMQESRLLLLERVNV